MTKERLRNDLLKVVDELIENLAVQQRLSFDAITGTGKAASLYSEDLKVEPFIEGDINDLAKDELSLRKKMEDLILDLRGMEVRKMNEDLEAFKKKCKEGRKDD